MILGLPLDAWALIVASVGLGLALELAYYRRVRRDGRPPASRSGHSRSR